MGNPVLYFQTPDSDVTFLYHPYPLHPVPVVAMPLLLRMLLDSRNDLPVTMVAWVVPALVGAMESLPEVQAAVVERAHPRMVFRTL